MKILVVSLSSVFQAMILIINTIYLFQLIMVFQFMGGIISQQLGCALENKFIVDKQKVRSTTLPINYINPTIIIMANKLSLTAFASGESGHKLQNSFLWNSISPQLVQVYILKEMRE